MTTYTEPPGEPLAELTYNSIPMVTTVYDMTDKNLVVDESEVTQFRGSNPTSDISTVTILPATVVIGQDAFSGGGSNSYDNTTDLTFSTDHNLREIEGYAFYDWGPNMVSDVIIPAEVSAIGDNAFYGWDTTHGLIFE